ncbi:uncharacterized protein RJT21DRAFT_112222 [Scheffersomyces amazonensis]|uniref:uncharacterized protein n=1 Tax=Scheffersomyces amazonensis TaxID=1078765 RepID=UPI00315D9624
MNTIPIVLIIVLTILFFLIILTIILLFYSFLYFSLILSISLYFSISYGSLSARSDPAYSIVCSSAAVNAVFRGRAQCGKGCSARDIRHPLLLWMYGCFIFITIN